MTTFQDPPPQSRRAIRHSERAERAESVIDDAQTADAVVPAGQSNPGQSDDAVATDPPVRARTGRRAQMVPSSESIPTVTQASDNPATSAIPVQAVAEPVAPTAAETPQPVSAASVTADALPLSTPHRPQVPSYDGPSFRNFPIVPTDESALEDDDVAESAPVAAAPVADAPPAASAREPGQQGRRVSLPAGQPPTEFTTPITVISAQDLAAATVSAPVESEPLDFDDLIAGTTDADSGTDDSAAADDSAATDDSADSGNVEAFDSAAADDADVVEAVPVDAASADASPSADTDTADTEFADTDAVVADDADEIVLVEESSADSASPVFIEAPSSETPVEAVPAEGEAAPTAVQSTPEQPLTRRQLREMRAAAERASESSASESTTSGAAVSASSDVEATSDAATSDETSSDETSTDATPTSEPISALLNSGPIILPYLDAPTTSPSAEAAPAVAQAAPIVEIDSFTPELEPLVEPAPAPVEDVSAAITRAPGGRRAARAAVSADNVSADNAAAVDSVPVAPVTAAPATPSVPAVITEVPSGDAQPIFIEPAPASARAVGHWSVQPEEHEDLESVESTITRTVGASSAAITTSALVLPSIPQSSDITGAYTATGEIMVTGSIDLPRSLSATGAHPHRVDNSDFDIDPLDREVVSSDSAPVRAIRAVSTHTSSQGIIGNRKPQSNRLLTFMVVSCGVLLLAVIGLGIAGFALGLFK